MHDVVIELEDEAYKTLLDLKIKRRMTWKEILYKGVEHL